MSQGGVGSTWRARCHSFVPLLVCALVPPAVHLIFGLDDVGLVEEWGVLHRFDQVGPVFWAPLDTPKLAGQSIRPLTVAPHSLAYVLDPDSYRWYHIIQALSLSVKALSMWALLWRLGFHRAVCFAGAIMFALFPAWDSLFTFRTIHIQVAMAAAVAAMALLLSLADRPTWPRAIGTMSALAVSVLHYEATYSVIALAPLLLLARPRLARRRLVLVLSVWYLVPFVNGLRIVGLLSSDTPLYQEAIGTDRPRDPIAEFGALTEMVLRGATTSWVRPPLGWGISVWSLVFGVLVVATFVGVAGESWRRGPRSGTRTEDDSARGGTELSQRSLVVMMASSLAVAAPVALVYWVEPGHLVDPLRVFSVASIPLALAASSLLELTRWLRFTSLSLVIGSALLVGATTAAVGQRTEWNDRSTTAEHALGAVFAVLPDARSVDGLVIVDPDQIFGELHSFLPELLMLATDYVLPGGPQRVALCHQPAGSIVTAATPVPMSSTMCAARGDTVSTSVASVDLRSAIVLEVRRPGNGAEWALGPKSPQVERIASMFDCVASGTCDEGPFGVRARVIELQVDP
jgi:hypothetical protein